MNKNTPPCNRNSNIEILRIVSMLLVLLVHYLPLRMPTTIQMLESMLAKAVMNLELESIGIICVHCFILISGYWGIKCRLKSFLGLLYQLVFWAIAGFVIAKYIGVPCELVNANYSVGSFISTIVDYYRGRWFVSAYVTLFIFSPVINAFVQKTNEKELLRYIVVFYLFSTIYGWMLGSKEFGTGLSAISLMGLYLVGGWLRKSEHAFVHWNKWNDMIGYIGCTIVLTVVSAFLIWSGVRSSIYGYLNPIVILESVFLFQFFRKVEIRNIGWVNYVASSAFAVFLLHCHPYLGEPCNMLFRYLHTYDCALLLVFPAFVAIFIISVIIDKIRVVTWIGLQQLSNKILSSYKGSGAHYASKGYYYIRGILRLD